MPVIKLNDGFLSQVEDFRASGKELDTVSVNSISTGDLSLPTIDAYQERLFNVWKVMFKFMYLTKKDAEDMDALAARLNAADKAGG